MDSDITKQGTTLHSGSLQFHPDSPKIHYNVYLSGFTSVKVYNLPTEPKYFGSTPFEYLSDG
jgi:hypothetical protein